MPDAPVQRLSEITVAIATRDRPEMLGRCLQNLLAAPMRPREIVIVDQSHSDQTTQVVQQQRSGAVQLVYHHQPSSGLGTAQNAAMARASGTIVAVTDDDCVPAAGWLPALEAAFAGPHLIDAVTGPVLPYGPERPDTFSVAARSSTRRVDFDARALPWDIGSGNNFAVRRAWLLEIGGNDERLGPGSPGQGGVDMDLFYRLARAGARLRYEPEAVVYHERASRASRLARRRPYGYGMGACCSLWLRQGDRNALRVLAHWVILRLRRAAAALTQRDGERVREEALVLGGTLSGLMYGWRAAGLPRGAGLALPARPDLTVPNQT